MSRRTSAVLSLLSCVSVGLFLVLAIGVSSSGALNELVVRMDAVLVRQAFYLPSPSHFLVAFMVAVTHLADPLVVATFEILVFILLISLRRRTLAVSFAVGLTIGVAITQVLKILIERGRPADVIYQVSRIGYSFPSGHTVAAMIFYGFAGYTLAHVAARRWQKYSIAVATTLIVLLVGYSRLFLGVHWLSDVLGGWLFGGAVLILIILGYEAMRKRLA